MMEGQDAKQSLDLLPRRMIDVHRSLLDAIETLCVLEAFLLGGQVRDVEDAPDKEAPSGVVDKCFDNLTEISKSIKNCHGQLRHIIDKLGATTEDAPRKL